MTCRPFITLVALVLGLLGFGLAIGPVQTSVDAESRSQIESCVLLRTVCRQAPLEKFQPVTALICRRPVLQRVPLGLIESVPLYSPRSPPPA